MSFENGHLSSNDEPSHATIDVKPSRSESELSDVNDLPDQAVPESADLIMQDAASLQSDDDEDADGSDDADYDAGSPPSRASVDSRRSSVSSEGSSVPRKRKANVNDEQYMQENPELYGLRRSVRQIPSASSRAHADMTQGRARPTRRIVRLSTTSISFLGADDNCRLRVAMRNKRTMTPTLTSIPDDPGSVYGRPPLATVTRPSFHSSDRSLTRPSQSIRSPDLRLRVRKRHLWWCSRPRICQKAPPQTPRRFIALCFGIGRRSSLLYQTSWQSHHLQRR